MAVKIQLRRDTSANWAASNPILAEGEIGIDTTLGEAKIGNGSTAWNSLAYGLAQSVPGVRYDFSTTTTDADPGAGLLRLNNATPASATAAFFDNVDALGTTVTAWLDSLDDSTNTIRGYLRLQKQSDASVFREYSVSGSVVDGTGYRKVTIAHVIGNGSFLDGDRILVSFSRSGNAGASGSGSGDLVAANNLSDVANAATARTNLGGLVTLTGTETLSNKSFSTAPLPSTDDGAALGSASFKWSDLWLASGAVINWNDGDVTLTHSTDFLEVAGGQFSVSRPGGTTSSFFAKNTSDSTPVGTATFEGDRATPTNGDRAFITFRLSDSAGNQDNFARITWEGVDVTSGSEDAALINSVIVNGSLAERTRLEGSVFSPAANDGTSLGSTNYMWSDLFLASGGQINFNNGDVTLTHAANLAQWDGANNYSFRQSGQNPAILLHRTDNHGTSQTVGLIDFYGTDSGGGSDIFARIQAYASDATAGSEDGVLWMGVAIAGTYTTKLQLQNNFFTPAANDGAALGSTTLSWSDLFLASGAVVNFNNGDITLTHSADKLTLAGGTLDVPSINGGPLAGFRNHIINGAMMVAQRGTSFTSATSPANSDDTYLLDRWTLLSDGNDTVDVTQATEAPTGGLNSIGLDVETVNKKFGIVQFIEQKNCIGLIGNTITLSFKAKVSSVTKLDNVKAAIIAWDGTADTVTSDIISAWGVEGTNPTLVANWTYENTPANLGVTTSWATYSVSAAVDTASTKNIAVFIWSDVTDTTLGDFLYITDVQLELGSVATPFERRPYITELTICQRYFYTHVDGNSQMIGAGGLTSNTQAECVVVFPTTMRVAPSLVHTSGTDYYQCNSAAGGADNFNSFTINRPGLNACLIFNNSEISSTAGQYGRISTNSASAKISFDAEL